MAKFALVVGIVWFVGMTPGTDQNRPDFGGKWTLVRDAGAPADPGIFGETFVATQYSTSLIIDWSFLAQARGVPGKVERAAHSAFIFDGTESNASDIYSGSSHAQIVDASAWDGQKLVIITTWRGNTPAHVTRKRTIWLDADGTLIVETSTPPERGGGPWSTARNRYRRTTAYVATGADRTAA